MRNLFFLILVSLSYLSHGQRQIADFWALNRVDTTCTAAAISTPAVGGYMAWWSAQRVCLSGASVEAVKDLSGNGYDLIPANNRRTTITASALNGFPAITFTGLEGLKTAIPFPVNSADVSVFAVFRTTSSNLAVIFELTTNFNSTYPAFGGLVNDVAANTYETVIRGSIGHNITTAPIVSGYTAANFECYQSNPNPETALWLGTTKYSGNTTYTANNASVNYVATQPLYIGMRGGSTLGISMTLVEMIVYPFKLTSAQQGIEQADLISKYAL